MIRGLFHCLYESVEDSDEEASETDAFDSSIDGDEDLKILIFCGTDLLLKLRIKIHQEESFKNS